LRGIGEDDQTDARPERMVRRVVRDEAKDSIPIDMSAE
jgi:hypothetical protein